MDTKSLKQQPDGSETRNHRTDGYDGDSNVRDHERFVVVILLCRNIYADVILPSSGE
jgi:hypothetical protein